MNTTIRQLAMQFWNDLPKSANDEILNKTKLCEKYYGSNRGWLYLTGSEIENIFYNEVILKWYQKRVDSEIDNPMGFSVQGIIPEEMIIADYLKEHSEPTSVLDKLIPIVKETIETNLKIQELMAQPQSVLKTIDVEEEKERGITITQNGNPLEFKDENGIWEELWNLYNFDCLKFSSDPNKSENLFNWIKQNYSITKK